jgi:hypothetical protein
VPGVSRDAYIKKIDAVAARWFPANREDMEMSKGIFATIAAGVLVLSGCGSEVWIHHDVPCRNGVAQLEMPGRTKESFEGTEAFEVMTLPDPSDVVTARDASPVLSDGLIVAACQWRQTTVPRVIFVVPSEP